MLKIRSSVFGAIHSFFRDRDFIECQAPNFVAGAVEGVVPCLRSRISEGRLPYSVLATLCRAAMPALERLLHHRTIIQGRKESDKEAPDGVLAR